MSDDIKFCYKCGAELPSNASFCPECGNTIMALRPGENASAVETAQAPKNSTLKTVSILTLIYGILAVLGAVMIVILAFTIGSLEDMMYDYWQDGLITEDDYNTFEGAIHGFIWDVKDIFLYTGIIYLISGAFALLAANGTHKRENFKMTLAFFIIATAAPAALIFIDLSSILYVVVGVVMCYLVNKNKAEFQS